MAKQKVFRDPYLPKQRFPSVKLPKEYKPYKYKKRRRAFKVVQPALAPKEELEPLTGFVQGKQASDLEERFARALAKFGYQFVYSYFVPLPYEVAGEENQIDFIVFDGGIPYAVEVGAAFFHADSSQRMEEMVRDQILNDVLRTQGIQPIVRLPWNEPSTMEKANEMVKDKIWLELLHVLQ